MPTRNKTRYIYVLKLENNKWWVSEASALNDRLIAYFNGRGSKWAKKHPPIEVYEIIPVTSAGITVRQKTLQMMKQHGWENVRGVPWIHVNLQNPPKPLSDTTVHKHEVQTTLTDANNNATN